jgi:hypothetical protein
MIDCRFCDSTHGDLLMCKPARRMLDALLARGMRFDMPTVEFGDPVDGAAGLLGEGTVLVTAFTSAAALIEVAGTPRATLIFSGTDGEGRPLPQWVYPADVAGIQKLVQLVADTGDMAIRAARKRGGGLCAR